MRILLTITCCMLLSSCYMQNSLGKAIRQDILAPMNLWKPKIWGMGEPPISDSPEFTQGWKDGCNSGIAAYGGDHHRFLGYKFTQDVRMIQNQDYYQAWQDSYLYCRWYIWNYQRKLSGVSSGWIF